MGRDIGGLGATIGYLQSDVDNLKKLREDPDRKDIESLLKTKETISIWVTAYLSILGTLGAALWAFGRRIWREMILPRILNAVAARSVSTNT
jgi:hypothetical protein